MLQHILFLKQMFHLTRILAFSRSFLANERLYQLLLRGKRGIVIVYELKVWFFLNTMRVKRDTKQSMFICLSAKSDFATCSCHKKIFPVPTHTAQEQLIKLCRGSLKVQRCYQPNTQMTTQFWFASSPYKSDISAEVQALITSLCLCVSGSITGHHKLCSQHGNDRAAE